MKRFLTNSLASQLKATRNRKPARARLRLDSLESRVVPADQLTATLDLTTHVLRIEGTEQADTIQVRHQDGQVSIDGVKIRVFEVDVVGDFDSVAAADVTAVDVVALAGNDAIFVEDLADGTGLTISAGLGQDVSWIHELTTWAPTSYDGGTGYTDYLYVYDLRPGSHAYTVTDAAVTGPGISIPYTNVTALSLYSHNGDNAADTFDVQSAGAGTQLHLWGYDGDDSYHVGGPAGLDAVRGDVYVNGINGTDTLTIDNTGGSLATRIEIGPGQARLPWGSVIDYNPSMEALTVRGGAIDETFALTGTNPAIPLTLDGGGGSNTLEYLDAPGLVSWYPGEFSGIDLADGHPGTPVNGAWYGPGRTGQAFLLDGVDDFVEVPDSPQFTPPSITLEAWVNPNTVAGNHAILSKYHSFYPDDISWALLSIDGRLRFGVYQDGVTGRVIDTVSPVLTAGVWQHVVGTFDLGTQAIRIYVDGVEVQSDFVAGHGGSISAIGDSESPVRIGSLVNSGGVMTYFWDGLIDEPAVYGRALTAAEVQALFTGGKGTWAGGVNVNLPAGTATGVAGGIRNIRNATGASGNDTLTGDALDNRLSGRAGDDALRGADGPDVLDGGAGSDFMAGGSSGDIYTFAAAPVAEADTVVEVLASSFGQLDFSRLSADDPVSVNLLSAVDLAHHTRRTVAVGGGGTPGGFHAAVGGAGNDTIRGNHRNNVLDGGAGNDTLTGANGRDTMTAGDGDDSLVGGAQNDLMSGGPGRDWVSGQAGDDWVFGDAGDDSLLGGAGGDILFGDAGNDYMQGDYGSDAYFGGDGNDYGYEYGDTADSFDGGDGNDRYYEATGSQGNDTVTGGAGDDWLEAGLDNDSLSGGDGNDVLAGGENDDTLRGGAGNDRLFGGASSGFTNQSDNDYLDGGAGDDVLDGGHNQDLGGRPLFRDSMFGGPGDDVLYGGKSGEYLDGGRGRDVLYGDDGRDTLVGDDARPEVLGDVGEPDLLYPGRGQDAVITDPSDRVVEIPEIDSISPTVGDAPVALQPGTLVTIRGTDLPAGARVQFGGGYRQWVDAAQSDGATSPDLRTITARVPRTAMSGTVWVVKVVGTLDAPDAKTPDDIWQAAPGYFTVRTFRNTYGFSFRNFGFNVSVPLVQEAFGTDQTNIKIGPVVTPVPTPQTLAFTALSALVFNGKGACFGMALLSQHLAHHPEWFNTGIGLPPGADPTVYNLTGTGDLFRFIERFHQHQLSQELINYTVGWKLGGHTKESVRAQIEGLLRAGDRPLISFQNGIGNGHVVVAYDLEPVPGTNDYYIHTYDPNRPFSSLDSAETNGQQIEDSKFYVGDGVLDDYDWRFKMGNDYWVGGFGDFMVIPYGTVPPNPTFPGTLPSLSDLILGFASAGGAPPAAAAGLVSAEGLMPQSPAADLEPSAPRAPAAETARAPAPARPPLPLASPAEGGFDGTVSWEGIQDPDNGRLSVGL